MSSSFFSWHIVCLCHVLNVKPCTTSSTFLFSGPFVKVLPSSILRIIPSILQGGGDNPSVYPFNRISAAEIGLDKFSFLFKVLFFSFFFHFHLFDGVHIQYSPVLVVFLFSKHLDSFWLFFLVLIIIIIIITLLLISLSQKFLLVLFYWSLSDNMSPQVSKTLLGIVADFNSAVVWMVFFVLLIFCSPCLFPSSLRIVLVLKLSSSQLPMLIFSNLVLGLYHQ